MASDASINKEKNKNTEVERSPLYSGVLLLSGLLWVTVLLGFLFAWGLTTIDFVGYLFSGENDPLIIVVRLAAVGGLLIPVIFAMWAIANVVDAWRMRVRGYRNLLTITVGLVFVAAIIYVNVLYTIAAIVLLVALVASAHFKFYPEYRGMPLSDLFNDLRFIRVFWQAFFVAIMMIAMKFLVISVYESLLNANALPNFDFLFRRAGFGINQSPDWYSSDSRYGDAFLVGVVNTLQVVWIGLVSATIMGILLGIFLLSQNWLVRTISRVYVEILRNTPLLIQLIFWYFVFWLSLPSTNLNIPNESIMIVPLRYFVYLFALIGAGIYVWRVDDAPRRLFNGFLTGFVIAELVFFLTGDGIEFPVIIALGILGVIALWMANQSGSIPASYNGLAMGAGALLVAQFAGHLVLDGLGAAGVIDNTRLVFGEVLPVAIFGPNVFAAPSMSTTPNFLLFAGISLVGIIAAVALYIYWGKIIERTGDDIPRTVYSVGIIAVVAVIAWVIAAQPISEDLQITLGTGEDQQTVPLSQVRTDELLDEDELAIYNTENPVLVQVPELNRFGTRVLVGSSISPNYAALLLGLVIYTSAYIGEIVRAGIQAVPWGQVEAARALGLSTAQTLRMIILPQALRVIIPPLGNQYLNLSKNSSLATAIAFSDTYQIGQTIMNQSGQSITGFFLILVVYLTLSLIISLVMNLVNSRFQLVTR